MCIPTVTPGSFRFAARTSSLSIATDAARMSSGDSPGTRAWDRNCASKTWL
jgi:hypothetical protein